jgi:hypothetical protein
MRLLLEWLAQDHVDTPCSGHDIEVLRVEFFILTGAIVQRRDASRLGCAATSVEACGAFEQSGGDVVRTDDVLFDDVGVGARVELCGERVGLTGGVGGRDYDPEV